MLLVVMDNSVSYINEKNISIAIISLLVLQAFSFSKVSLFITTYCEWFCMIYILYNAIIYKHIAIKEERINGHHLLNIYLLYVGVTFIRGLFDSHDYWDYKEVLSKSMKLTAPCVIYFAWELSILSRIIRFLCRWYSWIGIALINPASWQLVTLNFLPVLTLVNFLKKRYKVIFLVVLAICFVSFVEMRSTLARYCFGAGLIMCYTFRHIISFHKVSRMIFYVFLSVPLIFIPLGYSGTFNIFDMDSYMSKDTMSDQSDTRSALYVMVNQQLEKRNETIYGMGAISPYWIGFFKNQKNLKAGVSQRARSATESGFLNQYLYGGIIGATMFSIFFILASFYGIFRSNNDIVKIIGAFIIFRWNISFIDEPEEWIFSNLVLFFMIGICLTPKLREWSNEEWKEWFLVNRI